MLFLLSESLLKVVKLACCNPLSQLGHMINYIINPVLGIPVFEIF